MSKRSVSTDALETLGTIIGPGEKRDAIHLAVLPATAGDRLYPGQSITCKDGIATPDPKGLGIVDPFLAGAVQPEQMFWMVLRPRLVTSLRHVWSHPSFEDEAVPCGDMAAKASATASIVRIAEECDIEPAVMIAAAHEYLDNGEYISEGGRWESICTPEEFWVHFEVLTGRKVPEDDRGNFFSCSC